MAECVRLLELLLRHDLRIRVRKRLLLGTTTGAVWLPEHDVWDGDRSAVLLVRVWLEDGVESFRARLTSMDTTTGRGAAQEGTAAVASSPGDVVEAVRAWLDEFLRDAPNPIDSDE